MRVQAQVEEHLAVCSVEAAIVGSSGCVSAHSPDIGSAPDLAMVAELRSLIRRLPPQWAVTASRMFLSCWCASLGMHDIHVLLRRRAWQHGPFYGLHALAFLVSVFDESSPVDTCRILCIWPLTRVS